MVVIPVVASGRTASEEPDLASDLSDRGIGFQALGFAIVGFSSVALLQFYSGSDFWLYKSFQTAVTQLHWAFLVPLAALFDWGRKMFETSQAIREKVFQRRVETALDKRVEQALKSERKRIRENLDKSELPDDVKQKLLQNLEP
ncbi:MAG: hypothetical protein OXH69_11165 [Acidobacteria bacterium]|nr:hypothetical protein [Acidobacteriota bacterium]